MLDKLKQSLILLASAPRHLEFLDAELRKVLEHLRQLETTEAHLLTHTCVGGQAALQATQQLEENLAALAGNVRQLQDLTTSAAETRHASLWQLLTDQHTEITRLLSERSKELIQLLHHLRFLVAEDRAAIRFPYSNCAGHPSGTPQTPPAMAASVRDFLGLSTDEDPPVVHRQAGEVEVELPGWDNVIAPWLEEYKEWEPEVTKTLTELAMPGFTILDIGAHVGIFTLLASRLVGPRGKVIALEPDPINARFLRRNVMRSGSTNVLVLEAAAADKSGVLPLSRPDTDNTGDTRTYALPPKRDQVFVTAVAIDDLVPSFGHIDLVKLDLQGMDHVALRGMKTLLKAQKPVILMEFWPQGIRAYGDDPSAVIHWLGSLGYSWQALELPDLTDAAPDHDVCTAVEKCPNGYVNLLLRPLGNTLQPGEVPA